MSGRSPYQKGARHERKSVSEYNDAGLSACRVPRSGAIKEFKGDVRVCLHQPHHDPAYCPDPLLVECKARKRRPAYLDDWMENTQVLELRTDREQDCLCVVRKSYLLKLLRGGFASNEWGVKDATV